MVGNEYNQRFEPFSNIYLLKKYLQVFLRKKKIWLQCACLQDLKKFLFQ